MEIAVTVEDSADVAMANKAEVRASDGKSPPNKDLVKSSARRRAAGRRAQRAKRRGPAEKLRGSGEKRRGQRQKRRGPDERKEGVTVKRTWSGGKRRWDKKHYCVFCRRPQVKIARHLLRKHADEQEVLAASALPTGSKQRHLLLEHLRCRGNYLHNIEVIRQGSGEIVPWRQPSEEVDARNYLPCPLCLGFFLRADLWKHQVSCRKKLAVDPSAAKTTSDPASVASSDSSGKSACDQLQNTLAEDTPPDPDVASADQTGTSESGTKRSLTSDPGVDQNVTTDPTVNRPRKRTRVQAAASRLLPISSGASESCSEILHRMNQDNVSHQVKSDWLICKYGNKLMGNQDASQKRYDYISQKLRELGRLLLAAKSLDSGVQTLQDLLAPGHLSLVLAAARKASGYRWSRPPLAVKTTLKTVCEIAIGESLQDGDWEAAAKTTDFYHMLGREWDNLGLQSSGPDAAAAEREAKLKQRAVQLRDEKDLRPEVLSRTTSRPVTSVIPSESRLQPPATVPLSQRKVRRRPWSSAEKEAIWRQLGVHVLVQSVPGKEVCQRCLDLEPVLRGRHWKDIKNQVHNQIQSQKKQQFHAQMDLEENLDHQDHLQKKQQYQVQTGHQEKDHIHNEKKQHYHSQMDQPDQDNAQNQKRQQYHVQMDHQAQDNGQNQKKLHEHMQLDHEDHVHIHKKKLCHLKADHQNQDQSQVHKKQLYQMDQPGLQTLDPDSSVMTITPYGHEGPHRGHSLLEREPSISPYALLHRPPGLHMDQLIQRGEWTEESLGQNFPLSRQLGRSLLQDVPSGGPPPPDPHSGHSYL